MTTLAAAEQQAARQALQAALLASSGSLRAAAATLQVDVATVKRRLVALGLQGWLATTFPGRRGRRIAVVGGRVVPHVGAGRARGRVSDRKK
jgi:predicted ArsR family transcriptional regulator